MILKDLKEWYYNHKFYVKSGGLLSSQIGALGATFYIPTDELKAIALTGILISTTGYLKIATDSIIENNKSLDSSL